MSKQATLAITAAQNIKTWGGYAAARFAAKRGVPPRLLILAMTLEASK